MENVIILGSGPAGLTAAIYAARANLKPVLIEGLAPGGQLTQTSDIENFPGFTEPVGGLELMDRMRRQAERLGVRFVSDEASGVKFGESSHSVMLEFSGDELLTHALIVATGASARYLGLPSEEALKGRGVSACATCDGAFFKGKTTAVVGGGDTALEDALYLSRLCPKVYLIHRRDEFRASRIMADRVLESPNIEVVWNSVVEEVMDVSAKTVTGARVRNVKEGSLCELAFSGLFVAVGHNPNTSIFPAELRLDNSGYIVTERGCTSVRGVFAAGDVQDPRYRQAVVAAGSGCIAALEAERYLGTLEI